MTNKEKLIVKNLGYTTFALYYYICHNKYFSNKDMEFELGFSKESRYRALQKLKKASIINVVGNSYNREFTVNDQSKWNI
jgi:predicted transcriptional regulator